MCKRSALAIVASSLICVVCASCVKSKNAVSDPDTAVPDIALCGVWTRIDEHDIREVLVIGVKHTDKGFPDGVMAIRWMGLLKDGSMLPDAFGMGTEAVGVVTKFDDFGIMSQFPADALEDTDKDKKPRKWDKKSIESFTLVKYRVTRDRLEIWQGNENAAIAEIKSGAIKGTLVRNEKTNVIARGTLADSEENLRRYFATGGDKKLFFDDEKKVYRRLMAP